MKKVKFAGLVAGITTIALTSVAFYIMKNDKLKRKVGKKIIDAMNCGEDIIAKEIY